MQLHLELQSRNYVCCQIVCFCTCFPFNSRCFTFKLKDERILIAKCFTCCQLSVKLNTESSARKSSGFIHSEAKVLNVADAQTSSRLFFTY